MGEKGKFDFSDLTYLIPVHNEETQIEGCLRSVRARDELSKIIVIDDHSSDSTRARILKLNFTNVETIGSRGRGVAAALNTGLEHSRTRFCVRLDADDRNLTSRSKIIIDELNNENASVYFSRAQIKPFFASMRRPKYFRFTQEQNLKWLLLVSNVILHPSVCIDKSSGVKNPGYPNEIGVEDYLLWIQILGAGGKFKYINRKTIIYNRSKNATSSLLNRSRITVSEAALETFMKFQSLILGSSNKHGAGLALSGGGDFTSITHGILYFIKVIWKAPLRAKPNLVHNCAIMILKMFLLKKT